MSRAPQSSAIHIDGKRLACPFAKCFPKEFDADTPCTRRPGFDGYRLLNDHIRKYHSYLFSCQFCQKGFPDASQRSIEKAKSEHCEQEHPGCVDQRHAVPVGGINSASSQGKRKRQQSPRSEDLPGDPKIPGDTLSVGRKTKKIGKPKRVEAYPKRMTLNQDMAFESWMKSCDKTSSKEEHVKSKYDSLCLCLFGDHISLPTTPYYDYLMPLYIIEDLLSRVGYPSVQEIQRIASLNIVGQQPPVSPSHDSSPPGLFGQQQTVTESRPDVHEVLKYQVADPYSLEDQPGATLTEWGLPRGTDSGFYSYESDIQPLQYSRLGQIPKVIEDRDHYDPAATSCMPVDDVLADKDTSFSPGDIFEDQAVVGIDIRSDPFPHDLELNFDQANAFDSDSEE